MVGFCNTLGMGTWNLGNDLDTQVTNNINNAIDEIITPEVNKIKQKAKDIQLLYNDFGNFLYQKLIILGLYIVVFILLSFWLYGAAQSVGINNTLSSLNNVLDI